MSFLSLRPAFVGAAAAFAAGGATAVLRPEGFWSSSSSSSSSSGTTSSLELWARAANYKSITVNEANSKVNVWLRKKGALSAIGHNLCLRSEGWKAQVRFDPKNRDLADLEVSFDPQMITVEGHFTEPAPGIKDIQNVDKWTMGQILGTMRSSEILEVEKFPSIMYRAKARRQDRFVTFDGKLLLKGNERILPLTGEILLEDTSGKTRPAFMIMKGQVTFRQSDWGVKPLSRGFGALALQDEVTVSFAVEFDLNS
eukprot:NODE_3956_length_889_cov_23.361905_g3644_i0.p1 GENE.NODE_3956_length_889_cov_23.361905_g3644_i0~~NODE_3956_length_889_cov_23.361905_g3644_i0.p1  ORF type:complete len:255 (+),score=57.33 NODE_3956_length_889_cov_23.361905_g3644_i0:61-825(+)